MLFILLRNFRVLSQFTLIAPFIEFGFSLYFNGLMVIVFLTVVFTVINDGFVRMTLFPIPLLMQEI